MRSQPGGFLASGRIEKAILRDAQSRSRVSELQAAAERLIEKTALDRAWVLTRLQENVERSMQVTAVLDSEGNPTGVISIAKWRPTRGSS